MEIYPVVAALLHSNRRTDRRTDWRTKLVGAFHSYANAPKKGDALMYPSPTGSEHRIRILNGLRSLQTMIDLKIRAHCCYYQCLKCIVRIITPSVTLGVNWCNFRYGGYQHWIFLLHVKQRNTIFMCVCGLSCIIMRIKGNQLKPFSDYRLLSTRWTKCF